ncbi:MAG: RNA polymerase sigma factor [Acidobacteriota bacterium]|nr:RNA polymerase sigma factor [Acidobacteriota bacterium]MDH3530084.1 RNA polymerase sigma factor [Acidobacteriota bacterium]
MLTEKSDEQLVQLAVNEDPEAFGEIVKRWERKIFALCYGMLNREDEAKDAAQDAFIAAYRNLSKFRGEAKVSSWLHRIAVNQCLTRKRREKTRSESFFDDSESSEEKVFVAPARLTPSRQTEQGERIMAVRSAVSALPPDLRQIVVMKEFEEMTFQEISDVMEIPLSTVKSRLYTALKQLRLRLERTPLEVI